ncbi:hypothetical protein ACFX2K_028152 [Malus domestica]
MGSEGSHNTKNDISLALGARQRKKEGKMVDHQAKVDELETQNNKIAMKNEVLQEQYEKLFETLHETRRTQTRELITPVDINHHLGAPQHGGSPSFDMGSPSFDMSIPDEERANHQNIDQHETSLNPAASTRNKRSGGKHLLTKGVEGLKAVFHDCRDFLKQLRDNPIHVSSKINDPKVSEIDIPRQQHVNEVVEIPKVQSVAACGVCLMQGHLTDKCPQLIENEGWESANVVGFQGHNQQHNDPYSNTYNPGWRDHPNFKWREPQQSA